MEARAPALLDALHALLPAGAVLTRPVDRIAFASDASFYRLVPQAVVFATTVEDVRHLFRLSRQYRVPITFRAAGTSLSGQAVTDGLLVEVARHWTRIQVEDEGQRVRVQPGVLGGRVNQVLKAYGARIGPDPASINACTLGGILANNSSGMCCGVAQNAYHTLDSLTFVLPSGTVIDTALPDADERFRALEPALAQGLLALKRDVEADATLRDRIRAKYRTKNTTGYSLNALLDFERPVDIMRHLLVGSEGTLGFIAEAVLRTVPDLPIRHTGLLLFPTLHAACAAIGSFRDAGAVAVEIMDSAALRSVRHRPGVPAELEALPDGAAGLLVEFQARDEGARVHLEASAREASTTLALLHPPRFTNDAVEQARLWAVRQGMFPSVGAVRRSGTTVIIEDVAFPVDRLADAALDLTALFRRHGYDEAIIFGHAKDGNLHFVITQSFRDEADVDRYARLMDDVVALVVEKYDGALKAEHGTGRNMAPFVEAEWGPAAVAIMRRLKQLVDPDGILNPGVILNESRRAHLEHLKALPTVEPEVDKCIECGFCEPICPSRHLSLTPRQRIVLRREIQRLSGLTHERLRALGSGLGGERLTARGSGLTDERLRALDSGLGGERLTAQGSGLSGEQGDDTAAWLASLEAAFPYEALETCAVDGLCATLCPVGIDTGRLTKRFRELRHTDREFRAARWAAKHFGTVETAVRLAVGLGHAGSAVIGDALIGRLSRAGRHVLGQGLPQWLPPMPGRASRWKDRALDPSALRDVAPDAGLLYFPSCITRVLGPLPGEPASPGLVETVVRLARRAGITVAIPPGARGECCGVAFSSKGFSEAHALVAARLVERLWEWSQHGRVPILVDTSPCAYGLLTCRPVLTADLQWRFDRLRILDAVAWAETLLPRLPVSRRVARVAVHPVCSVTNMGLAPALLAVARACAEEVVAPPGATCCGFAGDRGFLVPALTASATRAEARDITESAPDVCCSSSRTCEIGLARATGRPWRSILHLLEEATR